MALGLAANPVAAEDTGFNFDEWFNNNVKNKPKDIPEIEIDFVLENLKIATYCETKANPLPDWCDGGGAPLFHVSIIGLPRSAAKTALEIGIDWTTATGETGYGQSGGDGRVIIPAGDYDSAAFTVDIPDDDIAHPCNKLIVNLRSLTPDRYKIAPLNAGGSLVLNYVDDDGANPDNEPC